MNLALLLPPLFVAALFLFLPFLAPNRFFTMPVPPDWRTSPQARRIRFGYGGLVLTVAAVSAALFLGAGANNRIVYSTGIAEVLALLAAWAWGWNQTLPARLGHPVLRSASLSTTSNPAPALAWTLAALLPLAASVTYVALHYTAIPPYFPMHYTATGAPDHMVARSPSTVFGLAGGGAALLLFLTLLLHIVARRGAGISDAGRYLSLTRTIFLGATWLVALDLSAVTLLPALHRPASFAIHLASFTSTFSFLLLLATFAYLLSHRSTFSAAQSATAEQHWKAGLWYHNPDDAALFVPKRLGIGYTLNMAHPASWLLMAATLALVVVALALKHLQSRLPSAHKNGKGSVIRRCPSP